MAIVRDDISRQRLRWIEREGGKSPRENQMVQELCILEVGIKKAHSYKSSLSKTAADNYTNQSAAGGVGRGGRDAHH